MTLIAKNSSIIVDDKFKNVSAHQSRMVKEETNVCPDCGGTEFETDSGRAEISCKRCSKSAFSASVRSPAPSER